MFPLFISEMLGLLAQVLRCCAGCILHHWKAVLTGNCVRLHPFVNVCSMRFVYMSKKMKPRLEKGQASTERLTTCIRAMTLAIQNLVWWAMSQTVER